jgi:prepilin-type N-terminal cleavage/methylation domain-containing protein
MRKKFMRNPIRQGFTLIELVVSMAVFSLMMLLMMQFFTDTQKLWSRSEDKANMYADARVAMDLMSSALQSVYYQESSGQGQHSYHQEIFLFSASQDSNTSGEVRFPVNLSRNSPLYPTSPSGHTDFAKPFYIAFWLDNSDLRGANGRGATDFTTAGNPSCTADDQEIIGNVTSLSFRLFRGDFSVMNSGNVNNSRVFPHSVQITMKMMPYTIRVPETTRYAFGEFMMCSSIQSSSRKPTMPAGIVPITTRAQMPHVLRRSCGVFLNENGLSLLKYRMMTAMMAPSWTTTRNVS